MKKKQVSWPASQSLPHSDKKEQGRMQEECSPPSQCDATKYSNWGHELIQSVLSLLWSCRWGAKMNKEAVAEAGPREQPWIPSFYWLHLREVMFSEQTRSHLKISRQGTQLCPAATKGDECFLDLTSFESTHPEFPRLVCVSNVGSHFSLCVYF